MGGDIPRKKVALTKSDMLLVNKIELAPHVGVDIEMMQKDTAAARNGRHLFLAQCEKMTVLWSSQILLSMRAGLTHKGIKLLKSGD